MTTPSPNKTIEAYNKNAEKYANKFDSYEVYRNKISDFQKKHIAKGSNILDLGCGPGNNIKTILENDKTCSFTGLDLSKEFINIAKQRFPQFDFLEQDIRSLDLRSKFKVIIASFCIVHLTNDETIKFLKDISTLIAKNGFLYLSYMNGEKCGYESTSFSKEEIFFNYYEDEYIIDILSQNNINAIEIGKEEYMESDGSITIDTFIYAKRL